MPKMRLNKKAIKELLDADNWRENLTRVTSLGMSAIGPLFSLLLYPAKLRHRAAYAIGQTVAQIAAQNPEEAKNVIRRFMWHMNEESGNIGWGIPDAFAECLAASPELMKTYGNILQSYIIDLGFDDNYCDNDLLRRSCYWAIGRIAPIYPDQVEKSRKWLVKGLKDRDSICRGMAAWALGNLPPDLMDVPALKALADSNDMDECEIYEDFKLKDLKVSDIARKVLKADK